MKAENSRPRYYDAHCHLQDQRLEPWLAEVGVEKIAESGIRKLVVNGTHPDDWDRVEWLGSRYDFVLPSYGLHPWRVGDCPGDWKKALRDRVGNGRAAIGEIGLDRWIDDYDIEAQSDAFLYQLRLAREFDLTVSIHCIRAWGLLVELLETEMIPSRGFLLHSYGGPAEMVDRFAALGARFSFSGYFALDKASAKREAFKCVPVDRLLVETDAPDMLGPNETVSERLFDGSDQPINAPTNLPCIYAYAARLKGMDLDTFGAVVESNFKAFFE